MPNDNRTKEQEEFDQQMGELKQSWNDLADSAKEAAGAFFEKGGPLHKAFEKIMIMSQETWQKFLAQIEKLTDKPKGTFQDMEKETFYRKTMSYWATLTPMKKITFTSTLALLIIAATTGSIVGGLIATAITGTQVQAFADHLAAPEPGYNYVMQKTMPDGTTHVKVGKTSRSPEIREKELEAEHGGDYRITHKKYVADMDAGERALKAHYQAKLGAPAVGREEWKLKPGIDTGPGTVLDSLPAHPGVAHVAGAEPDMDAGAA